MRKTVLSRGVLLAALIGLTLGVSLAQTPPVAPIYSVEGLAWMAGSWEGTRGKASLEEHWTHPAGGTMFAVSRTIVGGKTVEFEFLRIETRDDGIYYVAQPGGRPPTDFKLTRLEGESVVFENPTHDFPQRIIYRKDTEGTLLARIEGKEKGKETGMDFHYRRRASN